MLNGPPGTIVRCPGELYSIPPFERKRFCEVFGAFCSKGIPPFNGSTAGLPIGSQPAPPLPSTNPHEGRVAALVVGQCQLAAKAALQAMKAEKFPATDGALALRLHARLLPRPVAHRPCEALSIPNRGDLAATILAWPPNRTRIPSFPLHGS